MTNPYDRQPPKAFWRPAVAELNPFDIDLAWAPKNPLGKDSKIATAGSCFAQHIGRTLKAKGYQWMMSEGAPALMFQEDRARFSYNIFSFRTGNIYTSALLRQWVGAALGKQELDDEVWEEKGRFFDPLRPNVEPEGYESAEQLFAHRAQTLRAIKRVLSNCDFFVFTMGLTEGWVNTATGLVYPMCPGTLKGSFDPAYHMFVNETYPIIRANMEATFDLIREVNPWVNFILTVSPVPLTATATSDHVLTATCYSKSVLRAVAGDLATARQDVDYFPSFEIINAAPFRGMFFEPNLRSVNKNGVEFVMRTFFRGVEGGESTVAEEKAPPRERQKTLDDVVCEEEFLAAFGGGKA